MSFAILFQELHGESECEALSVLFSSVLKEVGEEVALDQAQRVVFRDGRVVFQSRLICLSVRVRSLCGRPTSAAVYLLPACRHACEESSKNSACCHCNKGSNSDRTAMTAGTNNNDVDKYVHT